EDETLALVLSHLEQVVAGSAGEEAEDEEAAPPVKRDNGAKPEEPPSLVETNHKAHTAEIPRVPSEVQPVAASLMSEAGTVVMRPAEESIRVPVSKLDHLMAEVSELLVARLQSEERVRDLQSLRRLHGKWRR